MFACTLADTASGSLRRCVRRVTALVTYRCRMRSASVFTLGVAASLAIGLALPAQAFVPAKTSVKGPGGQTVTVSQTRGLNPAGQIVTVSGRAFNPSIGVYVALCKTPVRGQRPGPCGGGVDMAGTTQASAWVSSNPPPYGRALAKPYRKGGRFVVRINVSSQIGDLDCRIESCSIVTRADHLRINDRSADVVVPVKFRQQ
jgi:hypothetical protein